MTGMPDDQPLPELGKHNEENLGVVTERAEVEELPSPSPVSANQQPEKPLEQTPYLPGTTEQLKEPSEPTPHLPGTTEQPQEQPTPHQRGTDEPTEEPSEPTPHPPTNPTLDTGEQQKEQTSDETDEPPTLGTDQEPTKHDNPKTEFQDPYHNVCPPDSAGQAFNSNASGELSNSVLVVNGLSSLGARMTFSLAKSTKWEVLSIASSEDRYCGDPLIWYRQDMLREKGVRSIFVDWSQSSAIGDLFKVHRPGHVVIVPPSVGGRGSGYSLNAARWASALHDFVALLETVKTVSPDTRMTLVSVSKSVRNELEVVAPSGKNISLLETLVGAFELTLSTYHTLYQIPFSVLRLKGLYGPWTHNGLSANPVGCFIDDVVGSLHLALSLNSKCVVLDFGACDGESSQHALGMLGQTPTHLTSPAKAREVTETWKIEYESRKRSRIVLTSYFTGHGLRAAANRFQRLQSWLEGITKHRGVEAVVLHDGLGEEFMERCRERYPGLRFELVSLPFDFGRNSGCRQSVLALAKYLEGRADIGSVVVMDVDRSMKTNLFPTMEFLGDWLYSDIDMVEFRDLLAEATSGEHEDSVVLANSLVLGGSRHMVLVALNKMADCLQSSQGAAALKCLMDENFVQRAVMGWPLSITV